MFSDCVVISDLYLFQEIALLNPCFMFYKNLMSSIFRQKDYWNIKFSAIYFNVAPVVNLSAHATGGSADGLVGNYCFIIQILHNL